MLIFAHIFVGTILGIILSRIFREKHIIPVCIAGSILPDILDKPLGYLFPQTLESGRTFSHTLLVVGIIIGLAIIVWHSRYAILVFCLSSAVLVHQVLDGMWYDPVTWFYPLMGPFPQIQFMNYFETYFWREITSLPEWIFLFVTIVLLCGLYSDSFPGSLTAFNRSWRNSLLLLGLLILCVFGIYSLVCAGMGRENILAPCNNPEDNLFLGLVALTGSGILIKLTGTSESGDMERKDPINITE